MGEKGEWALVGSRSPQYLWILSRTPTLPDATVDYIVEQAAKRGYNVKNLIFDR
jgi:lipocalin